MSFDSLFNPECCCGGGGGTVTPVGCVACSSIPTTLFLTTNYASPPCGNCVTGGACNVANQIQPCTLTYDPARSWWSSPLITIPPCSDTSCFGAGGTLRYALQCASSPNWNFYRGDTTLSTPSLQLIFAWNIGGVNTCHPFKLDTATGTFGGGISWLGPICTNRTLFINE